MFYAAAKWVEADEDERSPYMEVLLQCVRLENTSPEFLGSLQENPMIFKSVHCLQVVKEAQEKLIQVRVKQQQGDRRSFDSLDQSFFQSGDTPGFVPRHYRDNKDIKRKLLIEFLQTERRRPQLKDGSPHRRQKKNRKPDMRIKENRRSLGLQNMDESPDMRFKINKEKFGNLSSQENVTAPKSQKGVVDDRGAWSAEKDETPGNGKPDMRLKENRQSLALQNMDESPDMRFKENRRSLGPQKVDGTADMRFTKEKFEKLFSQENVTEP